MATPTSDHRPKPGGRDELWPWDSDQKTGLTHDQPWEELLVSDIERIKQELVVECHDDYVGLWAVIWKLERACFGISDAEIRLMALRLIGELLSKGDVRAGDVDENGVFCPWPLTLDEVITRINSEWESLGRKPNIGDIVWFTAWPLD